MVRNVPEARRRVWNLRLAPVYVRDACGTAAPAPCRQVRRLEWLTWRSPSTLHTSALLARVLLAWLAVRAMATWVVPCRSRCTVPGTFRECEHLLTARRPGQQVSHDPSSHRRSAVTVDPSPGQVRSPPWAVTAGNVRSPELPECIASPRNVPERSALSTVSAVHGIVPGGNPTHEMSAALEDRITFARLTGVGG